jgi:hypothetical protein
VATAEIDINLADGEMPLELVGMLNRRFGVQATVSAVQHNSALTIEVIGTEDQLRRVKHWHNAPHTPRPDLLGKPPVSKGERR